MKSQVSSCDDPHVSAEVRRVSISLELKLRAERLSLPEKIGDYWRLSFVTQ